MKRKTLSLLLIAVMLFSMAMTFTSCGSSDDVEGVDLQASISNLFYNDSNNTSSLTVNVSATNRSSSMNITSFNYKVYFNDEFGNVIHTITYEYYNLLEPNSDAYFSVNCINSSSGYQPDYNGGVNAQIISGKVASVRVVPVSMITAEADADASDSSSEEDSGWGFWTWFWVVIAGILLILFLMCCIGAEGDTDAIIGGVIIFLAPALIILFVHFTFFF